jgi:ABC-type oligopeptide transport system substrate-binding subunit
MFVWAAVGTIALASCASAGDDATPKPVQPRALRFAVVEPTTLDPAQAADPEAVSLAELTSLPLVTLDAATSLPRPGLARSWRADTTQQTFTFRLDPSKRFSTGRSITATDVKASLERVVAPATKSPLADLLNEVEGYSAARTNGGPLSGITTPTPDRVVVRLTRPDATFPISLGHPGLGVVAPSPDAIGGLLSTGAYAPTRADATGWSFRRVRGRGARRIDVLKVADAAAARTAVTERRADLALIDRSAGTSFPRRYRAIASPYVAVSNYAMNLRNPKFANAEFRSAVLHALDARSLVREVFGPTVGIANGVIPETVSGHASTPCADLCDHDVTAAKAALARAFPNGGIPSIAIDYDATPAQHTLAAKVVTQLAAVGITATPRPHDPATYDDFLANETPDLFRLGWVAADASAEAFLLPVFASGTPENVAHLSSPVSDLLLVAASREGDVDERAALYRRAERAVLEQRAVKPVVQYRTRYLLRESLTGLVVDALGGAFTGYVGMAGR